MSRSRRSTGAVRGPASALTSFLAGLGVEPSTRLTTWGNSNGIDGNQTNESSAGPLLAHDGPALYNGDTLDPAGAVTARTVEAGPSRVGEGTPDLDGGVSAEFGSDGENKRKCSDDPVDPNPPGPSKRRGKRASSINSEDLDVEANTLVGPSEAASPVPKLKHEAVKAESGEAGSTLKDVGQFMECGECAKRFTVTAYTKEHPDQPMSWLCVSCCYALGIDPFAKSKKAAKLKAVSRKEDRAKIVHYEHSKGVTPLGELCIQLVGKCIDDVDQLGDIGGINMDKVCRIISRSRRLNPETAQLFYSTERKELTMYDCTPLTHESYLAMANLCPHLENLHLHLCGQLSTDAVIAWGRSLKQLKRLELYGPFLVRKEGWISFFKAIGKRLEILLITQSPRVDLETVKILVKSCPNLKELKLAEVGGLDDGMLEPLSQLKKLTLLDLSSAGLALSDGAISSLLSKVGQNLESLNLSGNQELTDATLLAIEKYCPILRFLYLRNLTELTDDGVAGFFAKLKTDGRRGFEVIDLEKGHDLKSKALQALVTHSGPTVEKLSLHGWRDVSKDALNELAKCSHLKELDLGWCRQVTDFSIKDVLDSCDLIKIIKVWGCNQLSDAVPRKKGVQVIGIETHAI